MVMRPDSESMDTAGITDLIKKITVGVTEISDPINIPIGMTIEPGNLNDQTHFKKTYRKSRNRLREGSLVILDKGANSVANIQMIWADNLQYITGKKLNKSDDKIITDFETYNPLVIDKESWIHDIKNREAEQYQLSLLLRKTSEGAAGFLSQKGSSGDKKNLRSFKIVLTRLRLYQIGSGSTIFLWKWSIQSRQS
jgi:hypothetical protein